jgi:hypothetical protein
MIRELKARRDPIQIPSRRGAHSILSKFFPMWGRFRRRVKTKMDGPARGGTG